MRRGQAGRMRPACGPHMCGPPGTAHAPFRRSAIGRPRCVPRAALQAARPWRLDPANPCRYGALTRDKEIAMHTAADRIRNVALVGHRGSGKTSLHESLLFEAGAVNRLGSVADGSTVSDSAPDEKAREMSISSSLSSFEWDDRKVNLIDTPGEPSFLADALAALRVT